MAETLLAIALVTSSAKGSSLICHWPPSPQASPRLARARPILSTDAGHYDNPWRAANLSDIPGGRETAYGPLNIDTGDWEYVWKRPNTKRDRSVSFSHSNSHSTSGRTSPIKEGYEFDDTPEDTPLTGDYDDFLGYSSAFLASILCPQSALCHQKFELVVDDLCFIGHPVCSEPDNVWKFKADKSKGDTRGRGSRKRRASGEDLASSVELDPHNAPLSAFQRSSWLQTFHLVFVLDLPDPSSSASGNIEKYFDVIYEQVAFTLTAVLFQEQVLSNFVEIECDALGLLKDDYTAKGMTFESYMEQALLVSSIAPAMKTLYEAIKSHSLAHITIHNLPLELQLPPHLDSLLHSEDDVEAIEQAYHGDDSSQDRSSWARELGSAWRLPRLEPWKSLLLLDGPGKEWMDLDASLQASRVNEDDRMLADKLITFLKMADVTLSLADMATLLDWDLESQVFPIVRWLVHHRRAKVVDVVHRGLKTVFTLPLKMETPILELSKEFRRAFPDPFIPPLPQLLSTISTSSSAQFYAAVVKSKEFLPAYHQVVQWLLKKDLLVTLHVWIRVVATPAVKERTRRVPKAKQSPKNKRREASSPEKETMVQEDEQFESERDMDMLFDSPKWMPLSPKDAREATRYPSPSQYIFPQDFTEPPILEEGIETDDDIEPDAEETGDETGGEAGAEDTGEEDITVPTIIADPGRATYQENKWLEAMSEGMDAVVSQRFAQINRYFNGKCCDDEILYRAEISRKQLREVLHHYDEYLQIFLHPS